MGPSSGIASVAGRSAIATALVFAVLFCLQWQFFLSPDLALFGDFGANGLQVENAKALHELYGNYSRWGFHHPGPALFYWYALSESVLTDGLGLLKSAAASETAGSLVLQLFLLSLALAMFGRRLGSTLLMPVGLAIYVAVLSRTGTLVSIWPPHVLTPYFVAFLLFCVVSASGDARSVPLMTLCGGLLVHAHVAQPLFVVPGFLLALGAWTVNRDPGRVAPYVAVSVVILALFLVPLGLDLRAGNASNIAAILWHIRDNPHPEHRSLSVAAGYLLDFFRVPNSNVPYSLSHEAVAAAFVTLWLSGSLAAVIWWDKRRESRLYVGAVILALILSLYWAKTQDGDLFPFNTHFFYGVIVLMLMTPAVVLAGRVKERPAVLGAALAASVAGAGTALAFAAPPFVPLMHLPGMPGLIQSALKAHGANRVFLEVEPEHWSDGLAVANLLARTNIPFRADDDQRFKFGASYTLDPDGDDSFLSGPGLVTLHVGARGRSGEILLPRTNMGADHSAMTIGPRSPDHPFGPGGSIEPKTLSLYATRGFYLDPNSPYVWTNREARILFACTPTDRDVDLGLHVTPFNDQVLNVRVNGRPVATRRLTKEDNFVVTVPKAVWNGHGRCSVALNAPKATSPFRLKQSDDNRILGVGLFSLTASAGAPTRSDGGG